MSLANYYRPKTFADVIGQEHITWILQAKVQQAHTQTENAKTWHHNYLFYGPRGTGKTSTARLFAKAINAQSIDDQWNPSLNDPAAKIIDEWKTLDYVEIDAASHTGVDNIREEILDKVPYPPTVLKKKIYVIDEVHMLSNGAFNALLKTIEEPRGNVVFILATTEIHKVPDTIISRCQVFNFKKVPEDRIIDHLTYIATQENMKTQKQWLEMIAGIAEWCMRDAVKYLDQVSILGEITAENVSKFLGIASDHVIHNFLETVREWKRDEIFTKINNIQEQWVDLYNFAKQLLLYIDKNLHVHTDFYLQISEKCTEILATIRYYPYPAIVYKIVFNKFIQNNNNTENKQQTNINTATQPPKIQTENQTKDTAQETKQEIPSQKITKQETPDNSSLEWIKKQLIGKIEKPSIAKNISEHTVFTKHENGVIDIIIINKMTEMLLQKDETKQHIEQSLSEICGEPTHIQLSYQNKEDYFQNMLG